MPRSGSAGERTWNADVGAGKLWIGTSENLARVERVKRFRMARSAPEIEEL
jgi:hypothetical protein